jgi:hypothetical protein
MEAVMDSRHAASLSWRAAGFAIVTGLVLTTAPSLADSRFPSGRGGPDYIDPVTGYVCMTPFCDVLRLPGANCICQKENPGERQLSRLRLTCTTREAGAWVACPVKPRYGISTN